MGGGAYMVHLMVDAGLNYIPRPVPKNGVGEDTPFCMRNRKLLGSNKLHLVQIAAFFSFNITVGLEHNLIHAY